jgi:hypothetical protein
LTGSPAKFENTTSKMRDFKSPPQEEFVSPKSKQIIPRTLFKPVVSPFIYVTIHHRAPRSKHLLNSIKALLLKSSTRDPTPRWDAKREPTTVKDSCFITELIY